MRRALFFVGMLACSRPLPPPPQPVTRTEPQPAVAPDAGPCIEPDRDGDGVVDVCDACPDERGSRPDGCPHLIVIESSQIRITSPLFFPVNSATVTPPGRPILDEIAAVLQARPEIRVVEVRGHASVGERAPAALARRRAEAAMAYLTERGVEAPRLVAHGFSVDEPLDEHPTAIARARNRRVDFRILETTPRAAPQTHPRQVVPSGCPDAPPPRVGPCDHAS
ncbi:MAG: OmpA family protein [Polyangiales bacterium]